MSAFKIKTGTEAPSESYVNQNKPTFDKLVHGFKGFNLSIIQKTWLIGGSAGVAGVAAILTYFLVIAPSMQPANEESANLNAGIADSSWYVSPLPQHDIAYETFEHPCEQAATYTTRKGSLIHVPEMAFITPEGTPVEGPVQLRFREFHNVMDLFLAGAPMNYDSAGQSRTFESAGMFEILAYQGDQPLKLATNKQLTIDLVSYNDDPKFNLYYLDTNTRNWQYLDKSGFKALDAGLDDQPVQVPEVNQTDQPEAPAAQLIKPAKAGKSKFVFKVEYNKARFPELQSYGNVLFEVDESKSAFSASLYEVNWKKVELKPSRVQGHYLLQLSRPDTTIKVYVVPVFANADYKQAMQLYEQSVQQKEVKNQEMQARAATLTKDRELSYTPVSGTYLERTNIWKPDGFRSIPVPNLGTYNCDHPLPVNNYDFTPLFTENGKEIIPSQLYLADITINAIFESEPGASFKCNRSMNIVLWIVTEDKRLGIISNEEFRKATQNTSNPVFEVQMLNSRQGLEVLDKALRGEKDLKVKVVEPVETTPDDGAYTKTAPTQLGASLYPNPAKEQITVDIKDLDPTTTVTLRFFNNAGTLIQDIRTTGNESQNINISAWSPGVYFCLIESEGQGKKTIKFIKE